MNYTDDKDQVVFLKDGDIAVTLAGKSASGAAILSNGVPSFDLLSTLNSALSTYDENLSAYIRDKVEVSCEGLSNIVQGLSNSISADIQALSTALSTDVDQLRDEADALSSKICLSVEGLSGIVDELSVGISADVAELSARTKETSAYLNNQVIALWADVKGGVNYKGHLKSYRDSAEHVVDLSSIFLHSFPSYTPELELNNGWLYCFTTDEATGKYTTKDGVELEDRDYIIIHSHDEAVSAVAVSAICRDTVDIVDTADSDYVRISLLQQVSADLSADYTYKIDNIMDKLPILDELSANDLYLSSEISTQIEDLSAALSGDVQALSTALSTDIKLSAEQIDSEIKANDADIVFLSNDLSTLEFQHYNTTLSAVDRKTPAGSTISSDNLVITDPYRISGKPHNMYYMTFEYGTLVLKKMA